MKKHLAALLVAASVGAAPTDDLADFAATWSVRLDIRHPPAIIISREYLETDHGAARGMTLCRSSSSPPCPYVQIHLGTWLDESMAGGSRWTIGETTVLHELCHVRTYEKHGRRAGLSHGRQWQACMRSIKAHAQR